MIQSIKHDVFHSEPFAQLAERLRYKEILRLSVTGIHGSLMAFVAARVAEVCQTQVLVIVPTRDGAEQLWDDCTIISGNTNVHLYVHAIHHSSTLLDMNGPVAQMETLQGLLGKESGIIVASAEAVVSAVPLPEALQKRTFVLEAGKDHPFAALLKRLSDLGFERKDFVEGYGDFAVRGGIVDVYPFIGEHPVRIEFFGDRVESIREFDALSQRSIRELEAATIIASLEPDESVSPRAQEKKSFSTLFDYLRSDAIIISHETAMLQKEVEELFKAEIDGIVSWEQMLSHLRNFSHIAHSTLFTASSPGIDFGTTPQPSFNGSIQLLVDDLQEQMQKGFTVFIACDTDDEKNRIRELIDEEFHRRFEEGLKAEALSMPTLIAEGVHSGFRMPGASLVLYGEHAIFGRLKRRGLKKYPRFKGFSQREIHRLKKGDYVVHTDYGIGTFAGLQTIKVRNVDQEVMKILYDADDVLYVNLNFVHRLQKYSSREGHKPKLSKLGTPQWERTQARARRRIKDIARELIRLYAARTHEEGFSFSPDNHWQKEMEASFMYEDTEDQAKATEAVKSDMIERIPMDRLVCGDVGFGKTEVAVRAAFKAVLDGKQVAVLVPTTILAQQHYNTFLDRLGRYTVRVEALTRFKSRKDQQTILQQLNEGKVDIVIGTHRLLSRDVAFKDLGLLVIDEEHRFGVSAKEKLRQLRTSVDTLALTATPIPRTLQFSLMGARDLSIINTPPRNRLPIITEISHFDPKLVREAILREIHRGGQIYFIHDRIQSMDEILAMLKKQIPEARFHAAHGQMKGHELEKTMVAFLERNFDVLVCTKIIESGIDIPSVNTIIINRADRFGLAELYQLRGRVGRSNVQAYAFLLTAPFSVLPRATLQRLQAIQEFTELGSGFNLALRDLEIRGAGNLLGAEQSGFIMEMGFEMYQRVVEDAVRELREEEFRGLLKQPETQVQHGRAETVIESDVPALIPDVYVESDAERLDIYRRLYMSSSVENLRDLKKEIEDRFGEYPPEVENLFQVLEIKTMASILGCTKVELEGNLLSLIFPTEQEKLFNGQTGERKADFQVLMEAVSKERGQPYELRQEGTQVKLLVRFPGSKGDRDRLRNVGAYVEKIAGLAGTAKETNSRRGVAYQREGASE